MLDQWSKYQEKWFNYQVTSPNTVGLDISADGIKLIELGSLRSAVCIENMATAPLPAGAMVKNEIKDSGAIVVILKDLFRRANIRNKQVAIAVPRSSVTIKTISIDRRLTAYEIQSKAWIEATRQFPELVGGIYLDYQVVPNAQGDSATQDLVLVACRKEHIDPYLDILKQSNLTATLVDVNCYAFMRALTLMAKEFNPDTVALLNLDYSLSSLVVVQKGELIYAHDHSYDGHRLMLKAREYLQRGPGKSIVTECVVTDNAEQIEAAGDSISKSADSTSKNVTPLAVGSAQSTPSDPAYLEILRENLIAQLRHAMHFFYSSRPTTKIETLVLTGDCVNLPGLAAFVEQELKVKTVAGNPLSSMESSSNMNRGQVETSGSSMMLSVGLSMGGGDRINLLPWREKERKDKKNRFLVMIGVISALAMMVGLGIHFYLSGLVSEQKDRNDYLQSQIGAEQVALTALQKQKQEAIDLKNELHFLMALQQRSNNVVAMLNELPRITPGSVALTKIVNDREKIQLEGIAQSDLEITSFMQSIEKSIVFLTPALKEIRAKTAERNGEKSFELTIQQD